MEPKLDYAPIEQGSFWLPKAMSTIAREVDFGWDLAYWVGILFFLVVIIPMVVFVVRYRRKHENEIPAAATGHNTALEITWSVIPLAVVMACFLVGFKGYLFASVAPANAYEIHVTGAKWFWTFNYPEGVTSPGELVVPVDRPVKLVMSSKDVIHSFYVPAFRTKQDAVPGVYTSQWFEATETGETTAECTEYCGKDHSGMYAKVIVKSGDDFGKWLEEQSGGNEVSAANGEKLYKKYACSTCHSVDGAAGTGPSFKGLVGRDENLVGGTIKVDENYIRESILNPTAKVVAGYAPVMPSFKGQLKDNQIESIIMWMKTIQ